MATARSAASVRINLRASPEAKATIERAVALMVGTTVSAFILQTASDAAQRLIAEWEVITLSDRDREAFLAALENPPEPNEALKRLLRPE